MQAVKFAGVGHPAEIVQVEKPSPGPGQVLIRIGGAGVCHSDLHVDVSEFPLAQAVDVYRKLKAGAITGRAVLVPAGA